MFSSNSHTVKKHKIYCFFLSEYFKIWVQKWFYFLSIYKSYPYITFKPIQRFRSVYSPDPVLSNLTTREILDALVILDKIGLDPSSKDLQTISPKEVFKQSILSAFSYSFHVSPN